MLTWKGLSWFIAGFLAILLLGMFANSAYAEDLTFSWTPTTDGAEGYRIFMETQENIVADNVPVLDSEITLTADLNGECKNFWMRAYRDALESPNSNVAIGCPPGVNPPAPAQPPLSVGGFTITVTATPN